MSGWQDDAEAARQDYVQAVATIRGNARLSDAGKRSELAKALLTARQALAAAGARYEADSAALARRLQRDLFSPGSAGDVSTQVARAASYRDALDRVERLDPQDWQGAVDLLARSQRTGDDLLARAVLAVATERVGPTGDGWHRVIDAYLTEHPEARTPVDQLLGLARDRRDPTSQTIRSGLLSVGQRPPELALVSDSELPALARQADTTVALAGVES